MKKKLDYKEKHEVIVRFQKALMQEYSEVTIYIPDTEKWDYAIPENYTNYQDGFLFPDFEHYRGLPIIDHPQYGRLYLRFHVPFLERAENEVEKILCFDRNGGKYTVIIQRVKDYKGGNPSYFRFLPKVKKYTPKRKRRKESTP